MGFTVCNSTLLNEVFSSLEKLTGYSYYKYFIWCASKTQYMLVTF